MTREPDRYELAPDALERIARAFDANPTAQHSGAAVASILRYLARGSPAAAPATEREPEIVEGCEHNPPHLRMRPPSEPAAPAPLLPRVLAALEHHDGLACPANATFIALAAELRAYIAADPERK